MANEVHRHGALAEESAPTPAAPPPFYRTKLFWAKFWLVATGVWWGVCMQLLFYQGAGHPLAQLPNLDWYLGMSLVYFHRARHCFRPDAAYASGVRLKQSPWSAPSSGSFISRRRLSSSAEPAYTAR